MVTNKELSLEKEVRSLLNGEGLYYDLNAYNGNKIEVGIVEGDWKHEHLSLVTLMESNGFRLLEKYILSEDGDSYDAIHLYEKLV